VPQLVHEAPAHRTNKSNRIEIWATLQAAIALPRLLILIESHHLNTNFGSTENFHRELVVVAAPMPSPCPPLISEDGIERGRKRESPGFPRGPTRLDRNENWDHR